MRIGFPIHFDKTTLMQAFRPMLDEIDMGKLDEHDVFDITLRSCGVMRSAFKFGKTQILFRRRPDMLKNEMDFHFIQSVRQQLRKKLIIIAKWRSMCNSIIEKRRNDNELPKKTSQPIVHSGNTRSKTKGNKSEPEKNVQDKKTRQTRPQNNIRYDQFAHFPKWDTIHKYSSRCMLEGCGRKTKLMCAKCNIYLCSTPEHNCFTDFHVKTD